MKTIYSSTIEKSASVTQTINLIIIITTLVICAHFLLSAFFHSHPPSTGTPAVRVLQTPCLELVKHASCTGFVAKSRTSLCFLHDTFSQPETTRFMARQVWFVGCKTRNVAIQLVLQQCCKTSRAFLLPVLPYPRGRENARKTHPKDGSLSASNLTRASDTPFQTTTKEGAGRATHEMTAEEVMNLEYRKKLGKEPRKYTGTRE